MLLWFRLLIPISVCFISRQDTTFVSADDIIIIDIEGTAEGLQVTFFVRGSVSGVIPVESVVEAIQVRIIVIICIWQSTSQYHICAFL